MKNKNRRAFNWESFSLNLKNVMDIKNYSFRKLSILSGASHSSIYRAVNGKRIDITNIILICDFFNVDINTYIE